MSPSLDELAYLREGLSRILPASAGVRPLAITSGLRPLLQAEGDPGEISREHAVLEEAGVFVVAGGKYTTFRVMARDALAKVVHRLGIRAEEPVAAPEPYPAPPSDGLPLDQRVEWAVREAFARRLEDVVRRRGRLWLEPDVARRAAPRVAARMRDLLGWSPERERREIAEHDLAANETDRLLDQAGWRGAAPAELLESAR